MYQYLAYEIELSGDHAIHPGDGAYWVPVGEDCSYASLPSLVGSVVSASMVFTES